MESDYIDLVSLILARGHPSADRTGTGTKRLFGYQLVFEDINTIFPLFTTKFVSFKNIAHELLWFISGSTNTKYLTDNNVNIWNEWADAKGDLGPVYGNQWRNAGGTRRQKMLGTTVQDGIDQLAIAIDLIKNDPNSRRIIVDSWTVKQLPSSRLSPQENVGVGLMALPPCHMFYQFFVRHDGKLDMLVHQRSADMFLGVPYNIASYALLLKMVAQVTGKVANQLIWSGGDVHIYSNHTDQCNLMLSRDILEPPQVQLNPDITRIDDFTIDDFTLCNYKHHKAIKGEISV